MNRQGFRCYAERDSDGTWFAMCLDLNLYARGESLREVRESLDRVVRQYVSEAYGKDRAYLSDLVPRRAPMYFFARYYLKRAQFAVLGFAFKAAKSFMAFALSAVPPSPKTISA